MTGVQSCQPEAAPVRQYYYRTNECKADHAYDPACVCWHDEGTGPLASGAHKAADWRMKPQPAPVAQASRPRAFLSWAVEMFGPVAKLRSERLLRFVEEAIELAHAEGMEREVFNKVADRVYSRPAGDTPKEIGQAQACLETFAENIGLSSADEAEREWKRVQSIPQEEWTRRHSAKQELGIALPSAHRQTADECGCIGAVIGSHDSSCPHSSAQLGCGDPNCKDPNCEYGK